MSIDNWKEEFITSEFGPLLKRTNTKTGEVQLFSPSGKQVGNLFFIPIQKYENRELERARQRAMEQVNQYPQEDAFVKYVKSSLEEAQTVERIDNLMRLLSQHFTTKAASTATTSKSQKEGSGMWDEVRKRYETDEIFRKKVDRVAKQWQALRGDRSSFENYVEIVLRNYEVSKSITNGTSFARSDDEILQGLLDSIKEEVVQKNFRRATALQREVEEGSYDMNNIARFLEETYGLKRPPFTASDFVKLSKDKKERYEPYPPSMYRAVTLQAKDLQGRLSQWLKELPNALSYRDRLTDTAKEKVTKQLTDIFSMLMTVGTLDDTTVDKISTPTRKRDGNTYTQMEMEEFFKRGQELSSNWYTFVKRVKATVEKEKSERSYLSGDLKTLSNVARWQYPDNIQPDVEKRDDSDFWSSLFRTLPPSHELSKLINQKIFNE
jgi:Asp-tRNA(Asn)/Glu-tRNA(Gln) amidotransferase C subunit